MKNCIRLAVVLLMSCMCIAELHANNMKEGKDSVVVDLKIDLLLNKKKQLEQKISELDKQRNIQKKDMSYETIELMNDKQDSICLAARSELVDVLLEIKEIVPTAEYARYVLINSNILNKKNSNIQQKKEE